MSTEIPVADRLEIQELVARYAFRCDTRRYAEVSELFTPDGVWDESVIGFPACAGHDAIDQAFAAAGEGLEFLIHMTGNHQLTAFASQAASGTVHLHAEGVFAGSPFRILGYYADDYARADGRWRFARRTLVEIAPTTGLEALATSA
jgi:SnoaL-like domain